MIAQQDQPATAQKNPKLADLIEETSNRIDFHRKWDRIHSRTPQWFAGIALSFSLVASVLAAIGGISIIGQKYYNAAVAVFALIPGFIAAIESKFRFEARATHHYNCAKKMDSVRLDLIYTDISIDDAVKRINQAYAEVEYPTLGR